MNLFECPDCLSQQRGILASGMKKKFPNYCFTALKFKVQLFLAVYISYEWLS